MNEKTRALIVHPVVGAGERAVASEKVAEAENLAGALGLDLVGSQAVEMQKLRAGTKGQITVRFGGSVGTVVYDVSLNVGDVMIERN